MFILFSRSRQTIGAIEAILKESRTFPACLPNLTALKDALRKGKDWTSKIETIKVGHIYSLIRGSLIAVMIKCITYKIQLIMSSLYIYFFCACVCH